MFLRAKTRAKNGKIHRHFSVVENQRLAGGRIVQRQVLHLGELNDAQHAGWVRAIEALSGESGERRQMALFPDDRDALPGLECEAVHVVLKGIRLRRPRRWGGCFLALWLWDFLDLDRFWEPRLEPSRKGTRWLNVLKMLTVYRLIDPGSEFRLHSEWAQTSAIADMLGEDAALSAKNTLYRCLDKVSDHREALFSFLRERWAGLFGAQFDVLLYDLTSTYFEASPQASGGDSKKAYGYSRDHRPDCQQVVIALVITPDGFPLAYEVYPGNTADSSTLPAFLQKIESRYGGKVRRTWLMDRGIPTEETLGEMRREGVGYLVGTPKGRLPKLEASLAEKPWEQARDSVRVKLLEEKDENELYVYVESADRIGKERSMRRQKLKRLWARLKELQTMRLTRDTLLMRLGAAKQDAGRVWNLVNVHVYRDEDKGRGRSNFLLSLDKAKLRATRRREGRYLLRTNLCGETPGELWEKYILLTQIEQAFKELKGDLSIRPVYHQTDARIEAHIFICFLAYCLHVTLKNVSRAHAGGLTPRTILEKLTRMQMIDVHLPTTDGRTILLQRYTEPDQETALLLHKLGITLPEQPPPKVLPSGEVQL
ncbi:IS1634 family transposase [bacterium]|nr:IS1634 family transposase [bacterium]